MKFWGFSDLQIRVLCGVEHDDLKRLFHVSKSIREAVSFIYFEASFEYVIIFDIDSDILLCK